ncbi:MAG: hypothetical protein HY286_14255 [Planctomycetes bacterium]|nr:hypothetical protein [Planctomycetota bacterium]
MPVRTFITILVFLTLSAGCAARHSAPPRIHAESWPEADLLFHRDSRWLGADAAYSVPLGGDRVLWLFGDTFVASGAARARPGSKMIRNSVAIQTGLDPTNAKISFHWREQSGAPASFFAENADHWYWPLHGARLGDGTLILFLSRVRATPGVGLGFEADGWRMAMIQNDEANGSPDHWHPKIIAPPAPTPGVVAGQSVLAGGDSTGEMILTLAGREPGDHAAYVARWRAAPLAQGRLDGAEWWAGASRGWVIANNPSEAGAEFIMNDAGPECSLNYIKTLNRYIHIMSLGFGSTQLAAAFADRPEGPWSAPNAFFEAPECQRKGVIVYAGKAHPELDAGRDARGRPYLCATYATNSLGDFGALVNDPSLYYPRFVRIAFEEAAF